jgi:hypothetical protein
LQVLPVPGYKGCLPRWASYVKDKKRHRMVTLSF